MEDTSEIRKIMDDFTQYLFNKDKNAIMDFLDRELHHFRKRNIGWKNVQWHASVPEIGTVGSIGKISIDQLQVEIQNLVDRIGLDVESKGELEKVRDYLMQAKLIAESLN